MDEHHVSNIHCSWGTVMRGVPEHRRTNDLDEGGAVPAPFSVDVDIDLMHSAGSMVA